MKKQVLVFFVGILVLFAGQSYAQQTTSGKYDGNVVAKILANAITVGNSTCIPLETSQKRGIIADENGIRILLEIKEAFKKNHSSLKITGSQVSYEAGISSFIFLWINHEPKEFMKLKIDLTPKK
jgi:hypothetical protein